MFGGEFAVSVAALLWWVLTTFGLTGGWAVSYTVGDNVACRMLSR